MQQVDETDIMAYNLMLNCLDRLQNGGQDLYGNKKFHLRPSFRCHQSRLDIPSTIKLAPFSYLVFYKEKERRMLQLSVEIFAPYCGNINIQESNSNIILHEYAYVYTQRYVEWCK